MKEDAKQDKKPDSKQNNGKQKFRKTQPRQSKDKYPKTQDKFYETTKGSNDLSWHTPDAELLQRSATIPWSYQTGEMINTKRGLAGALGDVSPNYAAQAGFVVLRDAITVGGFGYQNISNQPALMAANSLLTTMRSRTRVRNTYDAPDIMMLMLAADNVYADIAWLKRIAATVNMFTYQNHYLPYELIKAQGVDPDWMAQHQFQFVTELNVLISEMNKVYIPSRMHLFELHTSRFSNYYTEGTSIKDQLYFFTPAFMSEIDYEPTADYQSQIKPVLCLPGEYSIDDNDNIVGTKYSTDALIPGDVLLHALRQMIRHIVEHDATADITGDMENAFGAQDRFVISLCDPNVVAVPVFDEEILETIHNSSLFYGPRAIFRSYNTMSGPMAYPYFNIVQDVNTNRIGMYDKFYLQKNDTVRNIVNAENSFTLLDVHRDPSPEKTFAITRLRAVHEFLEETENNIVAQVEFGADLLVNTEVYTFEIDSVTGNKKRVWYGWDTAFRVSPNALTAVCPFHYAPLVKLLNSSYEEYASAWIFGNSDIYSEIPDKAFMRNMNRLSLLTLLGAYNNV